MFNVALLGGGLDPISLHHEKLAETVGSNTGMQTWFMPCYGHLFPKGKGLADPQHRLNMVKLAAKYRKDNLFVPFDWEIEHKHAGSMYETISQLKERYPNITFHIVIGMDNANLIENKWDRGNLLIQENPFIVFDRKGVEPTTNWFRTDPHKLYPMGYDLSSTAIRESIKSGNYEFAEQHLSPAVWEYIRTNQLYGCKA